MAGRLSSNAPKGSGTPSSMPEGTPALASPSDHSWTLQAVMEMNKTVGILVEKVDRLSADISTLDTKIEGFGGKLEKVRHWQTMATTAAIVIGGVAGLIWTIITFVPWDRVHIDTSPAPESNSKAR